ncbi:MAG: alanyl-tRNA editing protein [Candidatus Aminicenantes bacterium]
MEKKTKRIYLEDPYRLEFEARVIEKLIYEQKPALVLDQTCFYPRSGGQPDDRGQIDGVEVLQVQEDNGRLLHLLSSDISSNKVKGRIDWQRRFDHMQQHCGQHILSQSFHKLHQAKTLSFHLGETSSTVEIDLRRIKDQDVEKVERRANEIVFEDREIKSYFVPEEKIKEIPLRKPPQKKGIIRVVEISGYDYTACGGTHPRRTGEVGLIKILAQEKIRGNIRFEFVCGKRALEDYTWKHRTLHQLSNRFTVHEREVIDSVEKLLSELKSQKKKANKMRKKLIQNEARDAVQKAERKIIKQVFTDRSRDQVRFLALSIIKKGDFVVLYGVRSEERIELILARSESMGMDLRELVPELCSLVKGKGGGSPSLVEIAGDRAENLSSALDKAYEWAERKLS